MLFWTFYEKYLISIYQKNSDLYNFSYQEQLDCLLSDTMGWNVAIAKKLENHGHNVEILIVNSEPLQRAWAAENGCEFNIQNWQYAIPLAQVKDFSPDVLWIGSIFKYFGDFLGQIKPYCKRIFAWTACPMPKKLNLSHIDCMLTSHTNYQSFFREQGMAAEILLPAFETKILNTIGNKKRDIACSFVGSLSWAQIERINTIKTLSDHAPIQVWSKSPTLLSKGIFKPGFLSAYLKFRSIKCKIYPSVWGMDMYEILARSGITINVHGEIASGLAGNMRMFEATGMGTLLITEDAPNIRELYEPDKEIVTYKNSNELASIVNYYINNTEERNSIARSGQIKTLKNHNTETRSQDFLKIVNHYL